MFLVRFSPCIHLGAGFVVLIHHNTEPPLIESAGIFLTPGRQHKLSFKKKATYLLPAPYSSCVNVVPPPMKAMFDYCYHEANYGYSEFVCYSLCAQTYM